MDEEKITQRIFEEITKKIDWFLSEKYPDFKEEVYHKIDCFEKSYRANLTELSNLIGKADDLKEIQLQCKRLLAEYKEMIAKEKQFHMVEIKKEINEFLSKEHPGVFSKLQVLQMDLAALIKKAGQTEKEVNKSLSKIIDSTTLCSDVYRMRDEMKNLRETVDTFTLKMKNLFK